MSRANVSLSQKNKAREISEADRRCKYVLEAVGVNRRVIKMKASGLENCGAAIILMFLHSCSALHLSSTLVGPTATDEHDWRELLYNALPRQMQNVDWNSQGSIVGQLEDYGSRVLEGGQLMIVSCTNSQKNT
jgi:hypothetical protein